MAAKKRKKIITRRIFISLLCATSLLLIAAFLFQISKSRTFQFFGGLTNHVETDQKLVALTFDDAPTPYTNDVLAILREKQVPATFYVIGQALEDNPEMGRAIVADGHQLGNHSYSHRRLLLKSLPFIHTEIQKTNQVIRAVGYQGQITFRPPNGKKLFGLPWYLHQQDMPTIMWDVEPDTYVTKANEIVQYTLDHTQPGSIILLHPFCTQSCAADRVALPQIIESLQQQGYTFVTVNDLLRHDKKNPMPITIGHRGAKGYVPENTRASFEKAIALGVDTVELDVQRCKTGELIVMHDESVDRTTNGQGNVAELTLAKIQTLDAGNGEVVPTLTQSFDAINRRVPVTIELKSSGTAQPTVDLIAHYISTKGWQHEDFVIASFDMNELRTVHALNKQILLVALLNELPPDLATFQQEVPATILSISSDKLTPEFITQAHQHGFVVYAWTVNETQDIARLTQWGIDGIVSDFPDRL